MVKIMKDISDILKQYELLGHTGYGVTEVRSFKPDAWVGYTDNAQDFVRLCKEKDGAGVGVHATEVTRPAAGVAGPKRNPG